MLSLNRYMSVITDGMDQQKTDFPGGSSFKKSKFGADLRKTKILVTGALVHAGRFGKRAYCWSR